MESVNALKSEGVVVAPTDTVYGLICNALDEAATRKIFRIKNRPEEKVLPIFVKDILMAKRYAFVEERFIPFLERVWPGKATVVLKLRKYESGTNVRIRFPDILTGGKDTIGIRIPDSPFIFRLFDKIDFPLAQTSANVSGGKEATSAEEVLLAFQGSGAQPDMIISGGKCSGLPSTVIDLSGGEPKILREGAIASVHIEALLRETGLMQ